MTVVGDFSSLGVSGKLFLLIGQKTIVFSGFTGRSSFGYTYANITLRGSSLVTGFYCDVLFIWDLLGSPL